MGNSKMEKVITGWWDDLPIWRYKTAEEKLLEELQRRNPSLINKLKEEVKDVEV